MCSSDLIVGVVAPKGQFLGMDLDDTVFIPTARALELYNREGLMRIHLTYRDGLQAADVAAAVSGDHVTLSWGDETIILAGVTSLAGMGDWFIFG